MDGVASPILENAVVRYVIHKLLEVTTTDAINELLGVAKTHMRDQYYWKPDLQEQLQQIRRLLPPIQAVVGFAEHRLTSYEASHHELMVWLQQFWNVINEAEEVLDELKYHELEKKSDCYKSMVSRAVHTSFRAAKRLRKSDDVLERLRTCVKNLSTSASDVQQFRELVTQMGGIGTGQMQQDILPLTNQSRITYSLPASPFKGRDDEKGEIIQYLLGDSAGESEIQRSQNVHCLPLVAMGGMGKTALAQQVFQHFEEVKKKHFHIKIWVSVSTDFNASSLMKKILESSTGRSESGPLELVPVKLQKKLHSKRFLLVLDDAWDDDNRTEWETLCAPLLHGQKGSWILLTTRLRSVAKMVSKVIKGTIEPMMLRDLSKDECRTLLYEHAFDGRDPNEFLQLKQIGEGILEKLKGVPFIAKSIGEALSSKLEVNHWKSISKNEVWKTLQHSRDEFIPALTLSYVMLPPRLKRCFSYCGIFPQGYPFKKQKVVGMWVAAGLIYSDGFERSDEDIANCSFDTLCNKSFFEARTHNRSPVTSSHATTNDFYTMHDILNCLARHVSCYECCRIVHDVPSCNLDYNAIRHISIFITRTDAQLHNVAKMVRKLKHLRTLWIQYDGDPQKLDDFIREAYESLRRIRVLIIESCQCKSPGRIRVLIAWFFCSRVSCQCLEGISDFVKLRFLDISAHSQPLSQSLSTSISKFYFLQVLICNSNHSALANDISKLTNFNLRHLYEVRGNALL